jgi:hypothetical protein
MNVIMVSDQPCGSNPTLPPLPPAARCCPRLLLLLLACAGFIEYWSSTDLKFPAAAVKFKLKMETDLFALAKAKTVARTLDVSKDGAQFAAFCGDGRVRVWRLQTGKLRRTYDESLEVSGDGGGMGWGGVGMCAVVCAAVVQLLDGGWGEVGDVCCGVCCSGSATRQAVGVWFRVLTMAAPAISYTQSPQVHMLMVRMMPTRLAHRLPTTSRNPAPRCSP